MAFRCSGSPAGVQTCGHEEHRGLCSISSRTEHFLTKNCCSHGLTDGYASLVGVQAAQQNSKSLECTAKRAEAGTTGASMLTRRTERRDRERRVLWVSLTIAAAAHAFAFAFFAWDRPAPVWHPDRSAVALESDPWTGTRISVVFGPPSVLVTSGEFVQEPRDRVLEAVRMMQVPPLCLEREIPPAAPGSGEVRLTVNAAGRIDKASLSRSTGDPCWDLVATRVAGALWYRWLPGDRTAPLEVLQPMTVGLGLE